jgi:hypothetical protein
MKRPIFLSGPAGRWRKMEWSKSNADRHASARAEQHRECKVKSE